MKYRRLDLIQGTDEWKQARLRHLTASQAPVLFGLSPYQSKLQLFEEKATGQEMPIDDFKFNLYARGHEAEASSRSYLEKLLGVKFEPLTLESVPHPDLMASTDGFAERDLLGMEAKYMGRAKLEKVKQGEVPADHLCQVQAQLLVSGAERWIYFATTEDGDSAMVEVKPDPAFHEEIVKVSEQFMRNLREGRAPEPGDMDWFLPEADPRFDELVRAKAILDGAAESYEALKSAVLEAYSHHKRVKYGGVTIVKTMKQGSVDTKKIAQKYGIDLDAFRGKPSEVVTVKVTKGK